MCFITFFGGGGDNNKLQNCSVGIELMYHTLFFIFDNDKLQI